MNAQVRRIDLATTANLDAEIQNLCENMLAAHFKLAATFVYETQLVLIFQR
ncbi:hypothetical protein [Rheinheimera riviphila]|uniref:hypothetical protein n=1 Tax=Rheinheimera riviphila TaxID=1834037 RepID=UPI0013E3A641|nr:hypothetical protein [Rheinheimera riviphila]